MSPAKGLNDIEAQIAALEAKLGGIDSDAEEDESSSRSGDSRSGRGGGIESAGGEKKAKKAKKAKKEKKEKKEKKRHRREHDDASDSESLERIAALPAHMLPEHAGYAGKGVGKRRKTKTPGFVATAAGGAGGANEPNVSGFDPFANQHTQSAAGVVQPPPLLAILAKRKTLPRCDVCAKDFTSQAQLEEHRKGKAHWRAARDAKAAAHGHTVEASVRPSSDGRKSGAGDGRSARERTGREKEKPPDGPHCALCRKTFTSEAQRAEHDGGKWHKMRVAGTLAPSTRPYA